MFSLYMFEGEYIFVLGIVGVLFYVIIDFVYMVVIDVMCIIKKVIDDLVNLGLSDVYYVEVFGIVVVMCSMD